MLTEITNVPAGATMRQIVEAANFFAWERHQDSVRMEIARCLR